MSNEMEFLFCNNEITLYIYKAITQSKYNEMEIEILKQQYKDAIKKDAFLKAEIAARSKVSTWTVDRWRLDDSPMLTTATNLGIIKRYLRLSESEILTETVINA